MNRKCLIFKIPKWLRGNEQYIQIIENHLEAELRFALQLLPLAEKPADLSAEQLTIRDGDEGIVLRDQDINSPAALQAYADANCEQDGDNDVTQFFFRLCIEWRNHPNRKLPD